MKKLIKNSFDKIIFLVFMLLSGSVFASGGAESGDSTTEIMTIVSIVFIVIALWLILVYSEKNDNEGAYFLAPFKKILNLLTASTPIENEADILLDHDYDGIKELDNKIPPWFHALFWGGIIFGIVYMTQYHIIGSGNVQEEEYMAEVQLANVQRQILIKTGAFVNEETVTKLTDMGSLNSGKEIFTKNCVSCHGANAEGLIGPNLTDEYWLHGGGIQNVFKTIKYGVPSKGMISWESQLDPKKIQEVGSYILSLKGTNPPNGKAPQGDKYTEE